MSSDNEPASPVKEAVASSQHGQVASPAEQESAPSVDDTEAPAPEKEASPPAQEAHAPSPADSPSEEGEARSDDSPGDDSPAEREQSAARDRASHPASDAPPLPNEPTPGGSTDAPPPLPAEAPPGQAAAATTTEADDGWSAQWDATNQAWYFYNSYTSVSQWDNPRLAATTAAATTTAPISQPTSIAGGYHPAIHGSWDPNAAYAQAYQDPADDAAAAAAAEEATYQADLAMYNAEMDRSDPTAAAEGFGGEPYAAQAAAFNRRTGQAQAPDQNPERHSDASKSYRQMNAYFNVDQAANSHDGRSLKAERRGKQPTRKELSMWKEKRKARKEERRRAWLRD